MTFKQLLTEKRSEVKALKNRYLGGLEKLAFAEQQVLKSLINLKLTTLENFKPFKKLNF